MKSIPLNLTGDSYQDMKNLLSPQTQEEIEWDHKMNVFWKRFGEHVRKAKRSWEKTFEEDIEAQMDDEGGLV